MYSEKRKGMAAMPITVGTPEEAGMSATRLRHIAHLAKGWVEHGLLRALVVAVARRGVLVLHEAYGTLTAETDSLPVRLDSIFPLWSISKVITATAVMVLVEDGLLGLNRPVAEYIPEFVGDGKSVVTPWHLLTHTSGLREDAVTAYASPGLFAQDYTLAAAISAYTPEYLRKRYAAPLSTAPGKEMSYCDFNFMLLGEIVQRVSGQSLTTFAHERIFQPLGMCDASYIVTDERRPRMVRAHPEEVPPDGIGPTGSVEAPWGAASVSSTALDVARFGQMFLDQGGSGDERVLSPASVAQMMRNQIPGIGSHFGDEFFPEAGWGLGWSVEGDKRDPRTGSLHSPATVAHSGAMRILVWVDPLYELVGVFCSALQGSPAYPPPPGPRDLFMNAVTAAVLAV
jgi:CubicO group peptidase (beta-lactamase class C family)